MIRHPVGAGFFAGACIARVVAIFVGVKFILIVAVVVIFTGLVFSALRVQRLRLAGHVMKPCGHRQKPLAAVCFQDHLGQFGSPRGKFDSAGKLAPGRKRIAVVCEQQVQRGRLSKDKAVVEDDRHHLGAELHHLNEKTDFLAFFIQALRQYVAPVRVKGQVVDLGAVGRAQVSKERGNAHKVVGVLVVGFCAGRASKQSVEIAFPYLARAIDRAVQKISPAVVVIGLAPLGVGQHFIRLLHRPEALRR